MATKERKFHNLISTASLILLIRKKGYESEYCERAIYMLFDKYGIKPKTQRGGKDYFNRKNACDCIERHIFELYKISESLKDYDMQETDMTQQEDDIDYGRSDMSAVSRELLANDGVFGSDENELYTKTESKRITIGEDKLHLFEAVRGKKINISESQYRRIFRNI